MNKVLLLVDPDFDDKEKILKALEKHKNDTIFMRDRKIDNKIRSYLISKMFVVVQFNSDGSPRKRDEQIMKCKPGCIMYFTSCPDGSLEYLQFLAYKNKIPINGKFEYQFTSEENLSEETIEEVPKIETNNHDKKMRDTIKAIRRSYFEEKKNRSKTILHVPENFEDKRKIILTKSQKKRAFLNSSDS